jgi:hypothetical protein
MTVAVIVTVTAWTGNAEDAVDCTDSPANTGAHGATHGRTHRARDAATVIRTLRSTLLHAAHNALGMRQRSDGEQSQPECQRRKPTRAWRFERIRRSSDRRCHIRLHQASTPSQNLLHCMNRFITPA